MSTTPDDVTRYIENVNIIWNTRISQHALQSSGSSAINPAVITLDQEVEYIWSTKWSIPAILFLILRYVGDGLAILSVIGQVFLILEGWPETVLVWIMQITLQMRIYALYNRSRRVLIFMTLTFLGEVIAMSTILALANSRTIVVNDPLPDVKICAVDNLPNFLFSLWMPIIIFEGLLCMFALWAGVKQLVLRSKLEGFRGGRAVDALVKGNVFYFLCLLIPCTLNVVVWATVGDSYVDMTQGYGFATAIVVGCRLVISLRRALSPGSESDTALISLVTLP
ncbi:hypothetical protein BV22DRAFT_1129157 [Leucogyrophana mollusca]|uniref:Uncharacterized protein n=1 Tax=Leucogyrophana mollusca TaxID=85980 RepID=A0ACB8BI23_9AGAM|nr:hypothetical protein BV22DRAFT_1129157 [Leucogyrophana mollusca]